MKKKNASSAAQPSDKDVQEQVSLIVNRSKRPRGIGNILRQLRKIPGFEGATRSQVFDALKKLESSGQVSRAYLWEPEIPY